MKEKAYYGIEMPSMSGCFIFATLLLRRLRTSIILSEYKAEKIEDQIQNAN